jgi:transposase-like protein
MLAAVCNHFTNRDQQIAVISALTEGVSIRSVERLTGIHRDTIMRLGARVGRGCAELHDRRMVGIRVGRLELDELWAFVGKK